MNAIMERLHDLSTNAQTQYRHNPRPRQTLHHSRHQFHHLVQCGIVKAKQKKQNLERNTAVV